MTTSVGIGRTTKMSRWKTTSQAQRPRFGGCLDKVHANRREIQQQPAPLYVAEDPEFNWYALRSPLEATSPLPNTGVVQRIVAGLFTKLQAGILTGRDQHEARLVLDMICDWEDMDNELCTRDFQRLNVYAVDATHGWLTAIAATAASTNSTQCFLQPGV